MNHAMGPITITAYCHTQSMVSFKTTPIRFLVISNAILIITAVTTNTFVPPFYRTNNFRVVITKSALLSSVNDGIDSNEVERELPLVSSSKSSTRRHPLFEKTNVNTRPMPIPHPEIWMQCLELNNDNCDGNYVNRGTQSLWDSTAHFLVGKHQKENVKFSGIVTSADVIFQDASVGAHALLEKCGLFNPQNENDESTTILPETRMHDQETLLHLTKVLSYYQSIVSPQNKNVSCQAKVVSTIGSAGTKCPRWHADHVPVRLVMSLIGPGCEYIPSTMETYSINGEARHIINRSVLNNLEIDDTILANDLIIPPNEVRLIKSYHNRDPVICAKAGDAVLLMGKAWEEGDNGVLAAVHRSPKLTEGEARILLTVDVADSDESHL